MVSTTGMYDNTLRNLGIDGDDAFVLSDMFEKQAKNKSYIRSSQEWDVYNDYKEKLLNNGFGGGVKAGFNAPRLPTEEGLKRRNIDPTLGGKLRSREFVDEGKAFQMGQSKHDINVARGGGASLGSDAQKILGTKQDPNIGIEKYINENGVDAFKKNILPEIATGKFIDSKGLDNLVKSKERQERILIKAQVNSDKEKKLEQLKQLSFQPKVVEAARKLREDSKYKGFEGTTKLLLDLGVDAPDRNNENATDKVSLMQMLAKKNTLDEYRKDERKKMAAQGAIEGTHYIFPPDGWKPHMLGSGGQASMDGNTVDLSSTGDLSTNGKAQAMGSNFSDPEDQNIIDDDLHYINKLSDTQMNLYKTFDATKKKHYIAFMKDPEGYRKNGQRNRRI